MVSASIATTPGIGSETVQNIWKIRRMEMFLLLLQGLRKSRALAKGEVDLRVGNGLN